MSYIPNLLTVPTTSQTALVREDEAVYAASGLRISPREVHARRVAREADRWLAFASERTRMRPGTITRKALDSATFSVLHHASSLAVPSKLTSLEQRALWTLLRECVDPWTELVIDDTGEGLLVRYDDVLLGKIQPKHLGWVKPLIPFGLTLHLSRVTGHDYEGYSLGCNVVLGHVGASLDRLLDALGRAGGDGRPGRVPVVSATPVPLATEATTEVPVREEHEALTGHADDVVLFRTVAGEARISVPHTVCHSPTGVDWGAQAGRAGMADLALSVLSHIADEETADQLSTLFVDGVVCRLPYRGGVIRAGDIRVWMDRTTAAGQTN